MGTWSMKNTRGSFSALANARRAPEKEEFSSFSSASSASFSDLKFAVDFDLFPECSDAVPCSGAVSVRSDADGCACDRLIADWFFAG